MTGTLQSAVAHHQAGRLAEAEAIYRHILMEQPTHADALHLLGVVAQQRGRSADAIGLIERALALNPGTATYHVNLAEAYRSAGNPAKAAEHAREALKLQPNSAEASINLGLALHSLGDNDGATAAFERVIELKPYWPVGFLNLGNLHRDLGRPYDAIAVYREGIRLCTDVPLIHNNISQVLLDLGQVVEALGHAQQAVNLRPDHPVALNNLGNALAAAGRREEAKAAYARAIQLNPNLAMPHGQLGVMMQSEGKHEAALSYYAEALRRDPNDPRFACFAATAVYELDRPEEAVARFRELLARFPKHAEAHNSLGYVLQDMSDLPAAEAAYREAIRHKPDYADAHLNLGLLLLESGETARAVESFREALRHDPHHPEALSGLGVALRDKMTDDEIGAAERVLAMRTAPAKRLAVLEYGLAQVTDARQQYERTAALAASANTTMKEAARAQGQGYDPEEHRAYVDQIIRAYPATHFERVRGWGLETDLPVFVLGLPRSGTSLVEQILASHPQVHGAGELAHFRNIYRSLPGLVGRQAPGVECIGDLDPATVQLLAHRYLEQIRPLAPNAARIVDKMPDNYLMLGLIATLFPNAKVIHTRRDVRDVGLSCWLTHFKHIKWANDLEHIAERIVQYQRLMDHWRKVLPIQMLEVDYEEVVNDVEGNARKLVAWTGLEWDSACVAFHETKRVVRTASMAQVREPVYQRSVKRWEHYREALAPLLRVLDLP